MLLVLASCSAALCARVEPVLSSRKFCKNKIIVAWLLIFPRICGMSWDKIGKALKFSFSYKCEVLTGIQLKLTSYVKLERLALYKILKIWYNDLGHLSFCLQLSSCRISSGTSTFCWKSFECAEEFWARLHCPQSFAWTLSSVRVLMDSNSVAYTLQTRDLYVKLAIRCWST